MQLSLEVPLMATIKPSLQTERLEIVRRAARHLLDVASQKPAGFGTMEIFPPDLATPKYNTTEYLWRSQIAWCWAKAGWLEQKVSGHGTQKHWVYKLKPKGRRPLEKIAEDPIAASFYVPIKRPSAAGADYPASWYQSPQVRGLDAAPAAPEAPESSPREAGRDKDDPFDLSDILDAPDAGPPSLDEQLEPRPEGGGASGGVNGMEGVVASFLEQNFRALESMLGSLSEIKKEIKAQSELVLDAAQRLERSASREDVAQAAAEIASVLARKREPLAEAAVAEAVAGVEATLARHEELHRTLATELATIAERRKADEESLADKIGESVATDLKEFFEKEFTQAAESVVHASEAVDTIAASARTQLGKFRDEALAAIAAKKPREKVDALGGRLEALEARAEEIEGRAAGIEDMLGEMAVAANRIADNFVSVSAQMKQQTQSISDSNARALDTASELVSAARSIVKEMLEVGMDRAVAGGAPFATVRQKALGAIDRLNDAEDRVAQRSLPSGAAILKPTSFSSLGGGLVPIGGSVDTAKDDDDDDEDDEDIDEDAEGRS